MPADPPAVGHLEHHRPRQPAAAIEPRHFQRDDELRAEFLRLHEGARGQRLARNPRREARDSSRCERWRQPGRRRHVSRPPAQRAPRTRHRPRSRGRPVRSRRSRCHRAAAPRSPAPSRCRVRVPGRWDCAGSCHRRDDQRIVFGVGRQPLDHLRRIGIGFRIEDRVRLAVAREEPLQADHARLREFADEDRPNQIDLDEAHAAQDQRPHDAFAEFRLGDHQRPQPIVRHDQGFDILLGPDVDHHRLARQFRPVRQRNRPAPSRRWARHGPIRHGPG